ncbi:MAG: hypothetical protein CMJ23_09870 [Phycisphaerae bacterium]|nr:hypothetical protein [Phycisphaerae bacterium]
MNQDSQNVILEAEFDAAAIIKYRWIQLIPIACFIVTIPIVLIVGVIYMFVLQRIVGSWSATLTSQSLIVRKGVFVKIEKTIPLEKITDLGSTQGPIMRKLDLKQLSVETAGQSGPQAGGSLVSLLGIKNTDEFRQTVLARRDLISGGAPNPLGAESVTNAAETPSPRLEQISETLLRIEASLERIADRSSKD